MFSMLTYIVLRYQILPPLYPSGSCGTMANVSAQPMCAPRGAHCANALQLFSVSGHGLAAAARASLRVARRGAPLRVHFRGSPIMVSTPEQPGAHRGLTAHVGTPLQRVLVGARKVGWGEGGAEDFTRRECSNVGPFGRPLFGVPCFPPPVSMLDASSARTRLGWVLSCLPSSRLLSI